jgi:molybdenum cofactor synthesis domain-containing protein
MMVTVEIIAIGNELLLGDVLDTNTHWFCQQVTGLGGRVRRAVLVRDEIPDMVAEIRGAWERRPHLLLLSGGLGPTDDDRTLKAVAEALHRPLELNEDALRFVAAAYERFAAQGKGIEAGINESRRKMAIIPRGSQPIDNPVGAAPAVVIEAEGVVLVALPGVPEELKGIWQSTLQPLLVRVFGQGAYRMDTVVVQCGDESVLAPLLREVAAAHPQVYIKSRAKAYGPDVKLRITLSCAAKDAETCEQTLAQAREHLQAALRNAGIGIDAVQ